MNEDLAAWIVMSLMLAVMVYVGRWVVSNERRTLRADSARFVQLQDHLWELEAHSLRVPDWMEFWREALCRFCECDHLSENWALDDAETNGAFCCWYALPPQLERVAPVCEHLRVTVSDGVELEGYAAWAYSVALSAARRKAEEAPNDPA